MNKYKEIEPRRENIRKLLLNNNFKIPIFQRSYSWEQSELIDFWDDISLSIRKNDYDFFLGTIVLQPCKEKDFNFIIDGQQRITTLIIFLVAIRNYLYSINDEDKAKEIHNDFIEKGGILKNKVSKLIVNKYDNSFFDKYIIKHNPTILNLKLNELSTGQKNLFSAYKYFFDKIKSLETFDAIRNYLEIVLDRTYLISIEVYDEEQAYLVFETLNARGLDLSASELIKNNIYAQAAKLNILDDISSSWDSINIRLGNQNIISFLKNYVTTHNKEGIVREKQLFKHLKNLTKLSSDVKSFVEELEIEAEVYNNLIEPTFDYWKNNDLVETINNIKLLNLKTCYPLLLSIGVNNKIKIQDKLSICKLIENLGFKYNVILNLNPNELEKKYATWSFKVRNNLIKIKELKKEISSFFPKVEDFVEAFSEKQIKQNKIANYILKKINLHCYNDKLIDIKKISSVEHILPQKPDKWYDYIIENSEDVDRNNVTSFCENLIYRIGNLTILHPEDNNSAKNSLYDEKIKFLKKSKLPLNSELSNEYLIWNKDSIEKRQKNMAEIAKKVW